MACEDQTDPLRVARQQAACRDLFVVSFHLFPRRDNRGDYTYDPQMPPCFTPGKQTELLSRFHTHIQQDGQVLLGLLHSASQYKHSLRITSEQLRRAGDGTPMFVVLWEFEVKPGYEKQFELAYGPDGEWVGLFRNDPNYLQTRLLRDPSRKQIYLTLDFWKSQESYRFFLDSHRDAYRSIDKACEQFISTEKSLGQFEN